MLERAGHKVTNWKNATDGHKTMLSADEVVLIPRDLENPGKFYIGKGQYDQLEHLTNNEEWMYTEDSFDKRVRVVYEEKGVLYVCPFASFGTHDQRDWKLNYGYVKYYKTYAERLNVVYPASLAKEFIEAIEKSNGKEPYAKGYLTAVRPTHTSEMIAGRASQGVEPMPVDYTKLTKQGMVNEPFQPYTRKGPISAELVPQGYTVQKECDDWKKSWDLRMARAINDEQTVLISLLKAERDAREQFVVTPSKAKIASVPIGGTIDWETSAEYVKVADTTYDDFVRLLSQKPHKLGTLQRVYPFMWDTITSPPTWDELKPDIGGALILGIVTL